MLLSFSRPVRSCTWEAGGGTHLTSLPFEDDDSTAEMLLMDQNFYARLKQALEDFFPGGWFQTTDRTSHLAYRYWELCQKLLDQGGLIHVSQQLADLPLLARLSFDALNFINLTQGNVPLLQLGTHQHMGSPTVIQRIQERMVDIDDFEDVMAELDVAAWYKDKTSQGERYRATLQEEYPYLWPDILVEHGALPQPLLYECKRILSPHVNRVNSTMKNANNQLRSAKDHLTSPCYGVVLVDLSPTYTLEAHPGQAWPEPPEEVIALVEGMLRGKNSHIDYLILVWTVFATSLDSADRLRFGFWRNVRQVMREGLPDLRGTEGHLCAGDTLKVYVSGDLH